MRIPFKEDTNHEVDAKLFFLLVGEGRHQVTIKHRETDFEATFELEFEGHHLVQHVRHLWPIIDGTNSYDISIGGEVLSTAHLIGETR